MYMYHSDDSKYQIKSNNGRVIECRICTYKRAKSQGGLMSRVNGKFEFVPMSRTEVIKYCLKK